MRNTWIAVLIALAALPGCGDSTEHKLLLAHQLIKNQPDKALEMADAVLAADIKHEKAAEMREQAMFIKAQAHLALNQLEASRKVLEQIKAQKPDDPEPVRSMGIWAMKSMNYAVSKSEFDTSIELQKLFDDSMVLGEAQADLMRTRHGLLAESEFLRARIISQDVARYRRMQADEKKKAERLKVIDSTAGGELDASIARLQQRIDQRTKDMETHLAAVMRADPSHLDAGLMYLSIITSTERQGWTELMGMADTLVAAEKPPAALVQQVARAVLGSIPDAVKPKNDRIVIAEKLLAKTPEDQRNTPSYLLGSVHALLSRGAEGDNDKAQQLLDQIHGGDAMTQMEAKYLMAWCLAQQKKYERARLILDQLETQASNSPQVLTLHAQVLMELNDLIRAAEQARRALDLDPTNPAAIVTAADIAYRMGKHEDQKADWQRQWQKDQSNAVAARMLMNEQMARNDKLGLERLLQATEKLLPLKDEHVAILIDGYNHLRRFDKTLYYADQLKRRRPDQLAAHLKYAEALMAQGDPKRASDYLETIKGRFPEVATGDLMMGQLMLSRQQIKEAHELLSRFVKANPTSIEGRLALARALASMERIDEARKELEEVLAIEPANLQAHAILARIELFLGNTDEAGRHISMIDETQVDEAANPALKAQILIQKDKLTEARDVCNIAVGRGNSDPVLRLLLARIYTLEKDPANAETHLLELARTQPNNLQVFRLLGEFYATNKELQVIGLNKLKELQKVNEVYARLAAATVLEAQGKSDDALRILNEFFQPLIDKKDPQAFELATTMARIHLRQKNVDPAREVFKQVQDAGIMVKESRLRQIDLTWANPSVHYTTTQLMELSKELKPEDELLRSQVLARLVKLEKRDQALANIEEWVAASPDDSTLLRWKGELLGQLGRYNDSVAAYRLAIKKDPKKLGLRARLVAAHLQNFDFPAAEIELRELAAIDEKAKAMAMAELGQLYVRLGLNREATKAFDELEKVSKVNEPTIMFAMGRAQAAIGLTEQARDRLAKVPSFARLFPSAQVELARLEMRGGLQTQAKERIVALITDARTRARCMAELLNLNPFDRVEGLRDSQLMQWADDALRANPDFNAMIPLALQSQWMRIRVILLDRNAKTMADYEQLFRALEVWQKLEPTSIQIFKGQLAVLARMDQQPKARQLFRSIPALANTAQGPLLSVVVGLEPQKVEQRAPLPEYFVALATGKPAAAKAAAEALETRTAIYKKDMLSILDRPDITSPTSMAAARQIATAVVALDAGLPHLSASLSQNLIQHLPHMTPAHSLLAQALLSQGMPLDDILKKARESVPSAGITAYLSAETKIEAADYKGAIADLVKLLENEPDNIHARYRLAQVYQLAGEHEQSIQLLEKMHADGGDYRIMVANDLAYLIATHSKENRLDEAHGIAKRAQELVDQQGGNALGAAALLDTIGWIELMKGHQDVALTHLSRSIVSLGDRSEVHYHIGLAYDKLGNRTWARYHIEQAAAGDKKIKEVNLASELITKWGS